MQRVVHLLRRPPSFLVCPTASLARARSRGYVTKADVAPANDLDRVNREFNLKLCVELREMQHDSVAML